MPFCFNLQMAVAMFSQCLLAGCLDAASMQICVSDSPRMRESGRFAPYRLRNLRRWEQDGRRIALDVIRGLLELHSFGVVHRCGKRHRPGNDHDQT